ncbi:nucleotidyl transferase AbiEii/AbiGii toxin family protein [Flavobacterium sp. RSB2_4_14]|uniref:nucleotidyl transferase AbiEii/AbiGii toxin family protein n=1 Tax=Flavobacterium sp. RSB2_4_14 TaxID=3447665 RepID=UPI003F39780C
MLQTQTTSPELLELLKKLMDDEFFKNFILVGGTSLALQIGHRNSIDIDLFGNQNIIQEIFLDKLKEFGNVEISQASRNIFISTINDIKVDFVNYQYPLLEKHSEIEGIRLASKKDIAAMKLNAILGRGSRKDFIDLYFLLQDFSLKEMINFYNKKFTDGSVFLLHKSLTYFAEADAQPQTIMFKDFNWETCKQKIIEEVIKL